MLHLEIQGALVVEELEVAENVGFDFFGGGLGIEFLEGRDDLLDGVLAVAALDDFEAGAEEAEGAFGHEEDALMVVFTEADAGGQARDGGGIDRHWSASSFDEWSGENFAWYSHWRSMLRHYKEKARI
jgi:hypothetical protein